MRILVLLETLTTGGAETFGLRLANSLAAEHDVMLAVVHGERVEPALRATIGPKVRFAALSLPKKRWWFRLDTFFRRLKIDRSALRAAQTRWFMQLVREFAPDIVHSHLLKADRLALDTRKAGGLHFRHVLTVHGDYAPALQGQVDPQMLRVEAVIRDVLSQTDAVVAISEEHRRFLVELDPAVAPKLDRIVNGYTPPMPGPEPTLPPASFRFGMVSRGVRQKGWEAAIAAFELLARADTALVLVGAGPFLDELAHRQLPANVLLCGQTSDPLAYIRQVDVALLPTLFPHESLPTVIIEYLVCGKPVIATAVGEIPAMLTSSDGSQAGRLLTFDGANVSIEQLAAEMASLMDDAGGRAEMSRVACAAASRFDMVTCTTKYVDLYSRMLAAGPISSSTSPNH